jgi:NADPH-dependent 2,4-dienoyl-CoA reductase/sulfur reductase-like enzyme
VTLCEAGARLGGQALLAQLLPGRAEFGGIVTNLAHEAAVAGATVKLNTRVDRALVDSMAPDAIILATGARPRWPRNVEFAEGSHVVDAWAVLRKEVNPGASVLIADWRNDWIGLGLAEMLAASGCRVRLAVNGRAPGEEVQNYTRDMMVSRCHKLGVEMIPYARLFGADADTVYLAHSASGEPMLAEGVDTLILAQGGDPEDGLLAELEGYGAPVTLIGDCLVPRTGARQHREDDPHPRVHGRTAREMAPRDQQAHRRARPPTDPRGSRALHGAAQEEAEHHQEGHPRVQRGAAGRPERPGLEHRRDAHG